MKRFRIIACVLLALMLIISALPVWSQTDNSFKFVVIGDNRPSHARLHQPPVFISMLKEIDKINPAFAVNLGDNVYGSRDPKSTAIKRTEYEEVLKSNLRTKMYPVIGNHDVMGSKANQDALEKEYGKLYYSFDYGNSHFIVLNSETVGQESKIPSDQLEWLREDLRNTKAANKFVFVHQPLYPVDGHIGSSLDKYPKERDALHSLFIRNKVAVVFEGHEHLFNEQFRNGVRYIISGGGGAPTYPSIYGGGDFYHYIVVAVHGTTIEMTLIKPAQNDRKAESIKIGLKKEK